jgi:beta-glucosidase
MRAHGAAVKVYREVGAHEIGLVVNIEPKYPASDSPEDAAAAARADAYMNRQYLDPAMKGEYPAELKEIFGEAWTDWPASDLADIAQPVDFIGINYYTRNVVRHDETHWPLKAAMVMQAGKTHTETGWEVHAPAFVDLLKWFKQRYGDTPLYITENGAAFYDPPVAPPEGVQDPLRVAYLKSHIAAVGEAIAAGVDVRGYMLWSLFDNLEWSLGYTKRFGMVHVDFESQKRTPKDSAKLYSKVIASNGACIE